MTKSLLIDPDQVRKPGTLEIGPIPLNRYQRSLAEERARRSDAELVGVYRDMLLAREFETMLDLFKREGSYEGIAYRHAGPAHLSIGQESAAVGQAHALGIRDHIYGSHRSHSEIIAKGLAAIAELLRKGEAGEAQLAATMRDYLGGATWAVVDRHLPEADLPTRAVQFLLYGLLAEIFGRAAGFNRGLGGSMHAFFTPFGIYPNNAIVGGSGPIATGAALAKKVRRQGGLVVANIGDGSTGCGPVLESLNFAAMGQFWTLWEEGYRGGLPVIFFFMDNFYAMGGQTVGETMGYEVLSRLGAGFSPRNLHAETIDGTNPLAVTDAVERARALIEAGEGPVLLDCLTYRYSGHSPSDASSYRTREEVELWRRVDPTITYGDALETAGVIDAAARAELLRWAKERVVEATRLATDLGVSPRLDLAADPDAIARLMFSNEEIDLAAAPPGEVLQPLAENPRVVSLSRRSRSGIGPDGSVLGSMRAVQFRDAIFEAIADHAVADDRLAIWGEENRDWGGAFGVYRGLTELLPYHRLFNAALSEAAIVGSAVGYALEGGRALVEVMYADFMGRAGDELFNQLAKWQAMSGGTVRMPVVVRISVGSKYGAQHSQDWSAMAAHVPGLKVVFPATPYDAKGLMASALAGNDPVIFFESQRLYDQVEILYPEGVPAESYRVPIGEPHRVREGADLTILAVGATLYRALAAADQLGTEYGVSAEVIDARSLVPFNFEPVLESVRKTGRLLLTSDACERGSWIESAAAVLQRLAHGHLRAPIALLGARNWITPAAEMENLFFPTPAGMLDLINEVLLPLPGHVPSAPVRPDAAELLRRAARGV
jgi:2-oxoisovalerate dehydrogenase E1 component